MQDDDRRQPGSNQRIVRLAFGAMALFSVLAGLVIWMYADAIGIEEETAQLIATIFVIVGIGDALVLHFWDRLFKDRS
jgi:hypothetical protein